VKRLLLKVTIVLAADSLLQSTPALAQVSPTTEKAALVHITKEPEVERADPDFAIVRWTSNNPGGSLEHYGVVQYGTDPTKLDQTANSPIRLNPTHSYTVFRVRLDGLNPGQPTTTRLTLRKPMGTAMEWLAPSGISPHLDDATVIPLGCALSTNKAWRVRDVSLNKQQRRCNRWAVHSISK
jgi:hypothetical protein